MKARPWRHIVLVALFVASPLFAEQAEPRFVAPSEGDEPYTPSNPGPHDPSLLLALSHCDHGPQPEDLQVFGPGLAESLRDIVEDERVALMPRLRAISALGWVNDDDSFELVASLALDQEAEGRLRIQALWAIGRFFEGRPGREEILEEALSEPDHGFRLQAVLSLSRIGSEKAMEMVDAHRMVERHVAVRKVLREMRLTDVRREIDLPREGLAPSVVIGKERLR